MSEPRVGTCIFCDDIRFEIGGKLSLMGIYAGDMVIPQPSPTILPKFGCMILVVCDLGDEPKHMTIRITVPSDQPSALELVKLEIKPEAVTQNREGAVKAVVRAILPMAGVPIAREGFIEVWAETDREKIRCGRLRVLFSPEAQTAIIGPAG